MKILDFGLALDASENTHLTETGVLVGTPAFLSPEQARGQAADARSDLFSFGCVLYCMCTKKLPFHGKNTLEQLASLAADRPAPVRELNPSIPEPLSDLIEELLAKDPADRPESAALVAERLLEIRRSLTSRQKLSLQKRPARPAAGQRLSGNSTWLQNPWAKFGLAAGSFLAALMVMGLVYLAVSSGNNQQKGPDPEVRQKGVDAEAPKKEFLSDMPKTDVVNWPFHKPKEGKGGKGPKGPPPELGGPITVKGQLSPHGIFMHPAPPHDAPASIGFRLNQGFRTFSTVAALNDSSLVSPSGLTFAVYGDGKLLWKSQEISVQNQSQKCNVSVSGVNVLKLEVTASGDVRKAHAVWVEPAVEK